MRTNIQIKTFEFEAFILKNFSWFQLTQCKSKQLPGTRKPFLYYQIKYNNSTKPQIKSSKICNCNNFDLKKTITFRYVSSIYECSIVIRSFIFTDHFILLSNSIHTHSLSFSFSSNTPYSSPALPIFPSKIFPSFILVILQLPSNKNLSQDLRFIVKICFQLQERKDLLSIPFYFF